MDGDTIDRLASGDAMMILAVCLVAVTGAAVMLWRRSNEQADARISDTERLFQEMALNREALDRQTAAINTIATTLEVVKSSLNRSDRHGGGS